MARLGSTMNKWDLLGAHTRQFLLWLAAQPRTYADAMEAWRTSCPRLCAWEDAMADDLIRIDAEGAASHGQAALRLSAKGAILLAEAVAARAAGTPSTMTVSRRRDASPGSPLIGAA